MQAAGLVEKLPRMLALVGPFYRHGQGYQQMCGWGQYTDQRQFVYERLVDICAGAAMCARIPAQTGARSQPLPASRCRRGVVAFEERPI